MIAATTWRRAAGHAWATELRAIAPRLAGTLGTSAGIAALGLVTGTLAARMLGPSHRGDLAQLLLWPQLVVTLGNLGVELGAVYLSGDPARRDDAPASVLALALVQSVLLSLLYVALIPFVLSRDALMKEALLMTPLIPLYLIGAVSIDVLAGRLRFRAFNLVRVTLPVAYAACIVALAAAGSLSALTAALAYLVAHGVSDVLALVLVWRGHGLGHPRRRLAQDALHYGVRAHVGRLTPQSLGADMALIAVMLSSRDLGLYVAASAFLAAPGLVASSVGMVVFPQVSATHQAGGAHALRATFALQTAMVLAMSALMFVLAGPLVRTLFGGAYADATTALRLLAIGAVAVSMRAFPTEVLRGVGRPGLTSLAEVANWGVFLIAVPAGGMVAGLNGIAAGVTVAAYVSLGVLAALAWRSGVFGASARPIAAPAAGRA